MVALSTVVLALVVITHKRQALAMKQPEVLQVVSPSLSAALSVTPSLKELKPPSYRPKSKRSHKPAEISDISTSVKRVAAQSDDQYKYYYAVAAKNNGITSKTVMIKIVGKDKRGKMCASNIPSENPDEQIAPGEVWEAFVGFSCAQEDEPSVNILVKP